jgi:hypothetical protein
MGAVIFGSLGIKAFEDDAVNLGGWSLDLRWIWILFTQYSDHIGGLDPDFTVSSIFRADCQASFPGTRHNQHVISSSIVQYRPARSFTIS